MNRRDVFKLGAGAAIVGGQASNPYAGGYSPGPEVQQPYPGFRGLPKSDLPTDFSTVETLAKQAFRQHVQEQARIEEARLMFKEVQLDFLKSLSPAYTAYMRRKYKRERNELNTRMYQLLNSI